MTFTDWVEETRRQVRQDGWQGVQDSAYKFYVGTFRRLGGVWNFGAPIYEEDWDMLVVLDACRWDLMAEVAEEYDFVDDEWTYSVASSSAEWMEKNFADEYATEMARTAHVTANPYSEQKLDPQAFAYLEKVWKHTFDRDVRTIPARAVTDAAIRAGRERDHDRLLVHYMQPHHPFVRKPLDKGIPRDEFSSTPWDNVWHKLRRGQLEYEEVWDGYQDNLRYVLNDVALLLENVDAERVLITADHGNLLGEYGLYAHPDYVPLKPLKRVPKCVTSATDEETHTPETDAETATDTDEVSREEQLEHLGYK